MQPRFIHAALLRLWGGHSLDQIYDVVARLKVMLEQLRLAVCVMSALNICNDFTFLCTKELST